MFGFRAAEALNEVGGATSFACKHSHALLSLPSWCSPRSSSDKQAKLYTTHLSRCSSHEHLIKSPPHTITTAYNCAARCARPLHCKPTHTTTCDNATAPAGCMPHPAAGSESAAARGCLHCCHHSLFVRPAAACACSRRCRRSSSFEQQQPGWRLLRGAWCWRWHDTLLQRVCRGRKQQHRPAPHQPQRCQSACRKQRRCSSTRCATEDEMR